MTFKEKEQLLRYIFNKRNQLLMYQQHICESQYQEESAQEKYLRWVHYALCSCSKESQIIIEKEFILHEDKNWWYDYYSRSTYYRMKHKAMNEFLCCLQR